MRTRAFPCRQYGPLACALAACASRALAQEATAPAAAAGVNLAVVATASSSFTSGDTTVAALNDDFTPRSSGDARHGAYGNWPRTGTQWVQYDWGQPISTRQVEVYCWDDRQGVRLPKACRLKFWDGRAFVAVANASGLGVAGGQFNSTTFDEVATSKLRLEMDAE